MTQKQIFIACPVGSEDSEVRKRSNKLLEYIIKPVAEELDCEVIRVDLNSVGYIPRSLLRSVKTASEGVLLSEAEPRSVRGVAK